jgi:hypothetical protein
LYDNNTAVVHSFRDEPAKIKLVTAKGKDIKDILSGEAVNGKDIPGFWGGPSTEKAFELTVKPHSYRVFKIM